MKYIIDTSDVAQIEHITGAFNSALFSAVRGQGRAQFRPDEFIQALTMAGIANDIGTSTRNSLLVPPELNLKERLEIVAERDALEEKIRNDLAAMIETMYIDYADRPNIRTALAVAAKNVRRGYKLTAEEQIDNPPLTQAGKDFAEFIEKGKEAAAAVRAAAIIEDRDKALAQVEADIEATLGAAGAARRAGENTG